MLCCCRVHRRREQTDPRVPYVVLEYTPCCSSYLQQQRQYTRLTPAECMYCCGTSGVPVDYSKNFRKAECRNSHHSWSPWFAVAGWCCYFLFSIETIITITPVPHAELPFWLSCGTLHLYTTGSQGKRRLRVAIGRGFSLGLAHGGCQCFT